MFFEEEDDVQPFRVLNGGGQKQDRGAEARYYERLLKFRSDGHRHPQLRHTAYWVLHNCVVHPLLGLLPNRVTVDLHKLTSEWLNKHNGFFRSGLVPEINDRRKWVLHNCVAHTLIGLYPCKTTFEYHDRTAKELGVPGWV